MREEMQFDHVQKLEGAKRLVAGKETFGDDSLQRRDRAADEEENDAHHRSFHLGDTRNPILHHRRTRASFR